MLRAVIVRPGLAPYAADILPGLASMQDIVGGYLALAREGDLDLWVNEDGIPLGLPFCCLADSGPLFGPVLVLASDDEGETVGLSPEQEARALARFALS